MMILFFISTDNPVRMKLSLLFSSVFLFCNLHAQVIFGAKAYVNALKSATDVMVSDVTSPVAASRYYAYITLAANETVAVFDPGYSSLSGTIRQFTPPVLNPDEIRVADADLTTILVDYKAAQKMLPSGFVLKRNIDSLTNQLNQSGMDKSVLTFSHAVADKIVRHVVAFAITDGFRQLQNLKRYTPRSGVRHIGNPLLRHLWPLLSHTGIPSGPFCWIQHNSSNHLCLQNSVSIKILLFLNS
jgi:hypothetical protein